MKKIYVVLSFALLCGCSKDLHTLTVKDFYSDTTTYRSRIEKELTKDTAELFLTAMTRYQNQKITDKLANQNFFETIKDQSHYSNVIVPKQMAHMFAVMMVKERLKIPNSAKFPEYDGINDSSDGSVLIEGDIAIVKGTYEAQNLFGTFLPGEYTVRLKKEGNIWVGATGSAYSDITMN